jgi:hypothetical protein
MNINHQTRQQRQKPDTTTRTVEIVKPDIIVHSGLPELDDLLGGFKAGEITLVDGTSDFIADLPNQLCANTYRTFQSDTIYIDGGVCADPYKIARYARLLELDQHDVLSHVHISRAFTVYQLSTLIQEQLEPLIKKQTPRTLIIGMLPVLYHDPDVSSREAQTIFKHDLELLQQLTKKYQLVTVFTNYNTFQLVTHRGLGKLLYDAVHEIVSMKQFEQCTILELLKQHKRTTIVRFASGQLSLESFGLVS